MLEIRSPLTSIVRYGAFGGPGGQPIPLVLGEGAPGGLIQLAGWEGMADAVAPALSALGMEAGLGDYRTVRTAGQARCYRLAPDRLLLRHPDVSVLAGAVDGLDPARVAVLDLSHARWMLTVGGPAAEDLMRRLVSVDVDAAAFPVGGFVQTGIHHVGVLIHRAADGFEILAPVTWTASLWGYVTTAALPFGYRVGEAGSD